MWSLRYIVLYTVYVESSNIDIFVITAMLSSAHHRTHDKDIRTHWTKNYTQAIFFQWHHGITFPALAFIGYGAMGGQWMPIQVLGMSLDDSAVFSGLWLRRTTKASSGGAEMMCTSWCLRVVNLVNFSWGFVKVSDVKLLRTVNDRTMSNYTLRHSTSHKRWNASSMRVASSSSPWLPRFAPVPCVFSCQWSVSLMISSIRRSWKQWTRPPMNFGINFQGWFGGSGCFLHILKIGLIFGAHVNNP